MGQGESRSLARIAEGPDLGGRKRDSLDGGGSEQIQVIARRDLSDGDNTHGPVAGCRLGRSGRGKRRDAPTASASGRPIAVCPADTERRGPAAKQSVSDLHDRPEHEGRDSRWQTTWAYPEPHCCCHLCYPDGGLSQKHENLASLRAQLPRENTPTSISARAKAKRRQTKESWILEELDFIAGRSARRAARDGETISRIASGARDTGPAQQEEERAKLNAISESAHESAPISPPDDIKKSGQHVGNSIRHSHTRREPVKISSGDGGGTKTRAANLADAKQAEPSQQQRAPVDILLSATEESEIARDKSEILTTQQARPTCECIGTADTGGFADATNLADANSAIATGHGADGQPAAAAAHRQRTGSSDAFAAAAEAAETCESGAGEISGSAASESGQKSGANCRAAGRGVQASSQAGEELTSDERADNGSVRSCNSAQQSAVANESVPAPADCQEGEKTEKSQEQQGQQVKQHQQVEGEKSRLASVLEERLDCATTTTTATTASTTRRLAWAELAAKYGRMTRKGQMLVPPESAAAGPDEVERPTKAVGPAARCTRTSRLKDSCFCHIVCALLQTLFPICGAFKDYSLPGDLLTDLAAGFTVAILHIPQGMAYGLLSGVEPIHGLYVSFVPVLIMSFMSKSRHASYGTFAIISMLLVNTIQQVRAALREEQARMFAVAGLQQMANSSSISTAGPALVVTDNHRPAPAQQDLLLGNPIAASGQQSQQESQINEIGAQHDQIESALSYVAYPSNIEILSCVCIVCGIVHVTMSLMRLGVLSLMFSDQLISSFTTAGAVHVLTSQLPGLFDLDLAPIKSELFKCTRIWWQFTRALVYDGFNQTTGLLSLASIAFLLLVKELVEPRLRARFKRLTCLPSELVLMAIVIGCSSYFQFATNYQVKIVGQVPSGLPEPRVPRLELVPYVLKDAISIALITFAMNLSIAQVYAKKFRYQLDANQELFALGSANIISSFFSCFPCASSLSRSSIQSNLNVKSQLCSLFSCCIVVAIICYFAHILHDLPKSTLSCIIVVALKGILMQLRDLHANWRLSKLDALVWVLTFVSVLIFGVTYGLILGICASIFMIFLRLLTPHHSILARLPGTDIFVDRNAFAAGEEIDQVKIFRFNSALCYLNRTRLKSMIEKLLPDVFPPTGFRAICAQLHAAHPHPFYQSTSNTSTNATALANESGPARVSFLIIDCSALSYCDYAGATTLVELVEDLEARKVAVYLAACPLKLIDMVEKIQGQKDIVSRNVYPTISDALGQIGYLQRVVVAPGASTFQEKPAGKGRGSSSSTGGSQDGPGDEPQADKRPSILFAPSTGG